MKTQSNDLYVIIKSLNNDLTSSYRASIKSSRNMLALFDYLQSANEFNEVEYLKHIQKNKIKNHSVVKAQLKDRLITFLSQQTGISKDLELHQAFNKGLALDRLSNFKEAGKFYYKALDMAKAIQNNLFEEIILTHISTIVMALHEDYIEKYIEISNRMLELTQLRLNSLLFHNFYLRAASLFSECRLANNEKHSILITQLKNDSTIRIHESSLKYQDLIYLYGARVFIYFMLGDIDNACLEQEKQYKNYLTVESAMNAHQPQESLLVMRDLLYYLILANKIEEYNVYLTEINPKVIAIAHEIPCRFEIITILYLIRTKQTNALKKLVIKLEDYLQNESSIKNEPESQKKEILFYISLGYLSLKEYEMAVLKFEEILIKRDEKHLAEIDLACRLLILICSLGKVLTCQNHKLEVEKKQLDNQSNAYYDYIRKKRYNAPLEKMVIELAHKIIEVATKKEMQEVTIKSINKMHSFLKNAPPFYKIQQAEFNICEILSSFLK